MGPDSGQSRGVGTFSFKDPLINVALMILPNQASRNSNQPLTIPSNSQVLFSLQPQDSALSHLSFTGPSVPVRFAGLPDNLDAVLRGMLFTIRASRLRRSIILLVVLPQHSQKCPERFNMRYVPVPWSYVAGSSPNTSLTYHPHNP
jgi:hypothetical protein